MVVVLVIFAAMAVVLEHKFTSRTETIREDIASQSFRTTTLIIHNEFSKVLAGLNTAEELAAQLRSQEDLEKAIPAFTKLLTRQQDVTDGWYAIVRGPDTLIRWIDKRSKAARPADRVLKSWIKEKIKMDSHTAKRSGDIIRIADTLHWVEAAGHRVPGVAFFFGIDINLQSLQRHLSNTEERIQAISTIVDNRGYYISSPEQELVGTKVPDSLKRLNGKTLMKDKVSTYEESYSGYLRLPVDRFYTPFRVRSMNWTLIVDSPLFLAVEDTQAIGRYILVIFVASALIILLLIGLAQAKWQKEFMLRQEAEMTKQRLSLEKQALMLTTEKQKTENALLQLDKLKEKVDPHFLFNSLTSLNALIEEKPELAKSFVVKLSRVYRYVLDPPESGLATLSQEMRFATEYFFLLQIRFGSSLVPLTTNIRDEHQTALLPFMSIQILLENAVKHNIVSKASPLHIRIESLNNGIMVTNNLQLRQDQRASGKHGLKYLRKTFTFFGVSGFQYEITGDTFVCFLPFINSEDILTP